MFLLRCRDLDLFQICHCGFGGVVRLSRTRCCWGQLQFLFATLCINVSVFGTGPSVLLRRSQAVVSSTVFEDSHTVRPCLCYSTEKCPVDSALSKFVQEKSCVVLFRGRHLRIFTQKILFSPEFPSAKTDFCQFIKSKTQSPVEHINT